MPDKSPTGKKPSPRPTDAAQKPPAPVKPKGADRQARLAEALRENLRRRKAGASGEKEKDA